MRVPRGWHGRVELRAVGALPARHGHASFAVEPRGGTDHPGAGAAATRGVAWLVAELRHGSLPGPVGGTDWGLTTDALFALHAAGIGRDAARTVTRALAAHLDDYIGPHLFGDPRARLAGPTAKALVAAVVAGRKPRDFGGRNMRAEVVSLLQGPHGEQPGRLSDVRTGSDTSNTFSQALAVVGLARSGDVPLPAVRFLRSQQCAPGWFRMFPNDGRSCEQARGRGNASPDVDGTAMAVQAMLAADLDGVAGLDRPVHRGLDWLARAQRPDGSFSGGSATPRPNANSTGLAAQALAAGGRSGPAGQAVRWLRSVQLAGNARGTAAAGEQGAVGYDRDAVRTALDDGLTSMARDQWRRTTSQAVLGLAKVWFGRLGNSPLGADPDPPPGGGSAPDPGGGDPGDSGTDAPTGGGGTSGGSGGGSGSDGSGSSGGSGGSGGSGPGGGATVQAPLAGIEGKVPRALAGFLVDQLHGGTQVEVTREGETYVDHRATVDVALALHQLGGGRQLRDAIGAAELSGPAVRASVHGVPYERRGAFYADAAADLVLLGALQQRDTTTLTRALEHSLDSEGWARSTGRHADTDRDVTTQASVLLALTAAGRTDSAGQAAEALLATRCADGSFPATAEPAGCVAGDVAVTGLAVQALAAAPASVLGTAPVAAAPLPDTRTAAVEGAAAVLLATQDDDGLWHRSDGSTDVAASGAADAGLRTVTAASPEAAASLARLQGDDGGFGAAGRAPSDLAISLAAAPTIAGASTVTMAGSVLAPALAVDPTAPAPTTTAAPTPVAAETTAAATNGTEVPRAVLIGLLVLLGVGVLVVVRVVLRRQLRHRWEPAA